MKTTWSQGWRMFLMTQTGPYGRPTCVTCSNNVESRDMSMATLRDPILPSILSARKTGILMITMLGCLSSRISLFLRQYMWDKTLQLSKCGPILRLYMKLPATPWLSITSTHFSSVMLKRVTTLSSTSIPWKQPGSTWILSVPKNSKPRTYSSKLSFHHLCHHLGTISRRLILPKFVAIQLKTHSKI